MNALDIYADVRSCRPTYRDTHRDLAPTEGIPHVLDTGHRWPWQGLVIRLVWGTTTLGDGLYMRHGERTLDER
jgi:hypothetical protein